MDIDRNTFPITFEPVRKLLLAAYRSGDFSSADAAIARNTVKQAAMVWKLMNGSMDAYCWSSGRAVAYMLSRTSHPGYMLQLTSFVRGHATGDTNIKHAGELHLPDGACAVGVEHADLGIEGELAERFGIFITLDAYERFGHAGDPLDHGESVQPDARDADREISSCER
ncbi:hypothetical protein [Collinsella sp. CLA-AA-H302]|uniref:hypothetical protein n=1 Tax=Collinsella sp. CLA-AA-H302 TaxID=3136217 RepID=UPI0032C0596D